MTTAFEEKNKVKNVILYSIIGIIVSFVLILLFPLPFKLIGFICLVGASIALQQFAKKLKRKTYPAADPQQLVDDHTTQTYVEAENLGLDPDIFLAAASGTDEVIDDSIDDSVEDDNKCFIYGSPPCDPVDAYEIVDGCCQLKLSDAPALPPEVQVTLSIVEEVSKAIAVDYLTQTVAPQMVNRLATNPTVQRLAGSLSSKIASAAPKATGAASRAGARIAASVVKLKSSAKAIGASAKAALKAGGTSLKNLVSKLVGKTIAKIASKISTKISMATSRISSPIGAILMLFEGLSIGIDLADPEGYNNFTENKLNVEAAIATHLGVEDLAKYKGLELPYIFPIAEAFPTEYELVKLTLQEKFMAPIFENLTDDQINSIVDEAENPGAAKAVLNEIDAEYEKLVNEDPVERDRLIFDVLSVNDDVKDKIAIYEKYSTAKRVAVSFSIEGIRWWNLKHREEWYKYNDVFDAQVAPPSNLGQLWRELLNAEDKIGNLNELHNDKLQKLLLLKTDISQDEFNQLNLPASLDTTYYIKVEKGTETKYYVPKPYTAPAVAIWSDQYYILDVENPGTADKRNGKLVKIDDKIPIYFPGGHIVSYCEKFRDAQFMGSFDANDGIDPKKYCVYFDDGTGEPDTVVPPVDFSLDADGKFTGDFDTSLYKGGYGAGLFKGLDGLNLNSTEPTIIKKGEDRKKLGGVGCVYTDKFCTRMGMKHLYDHETKRTECFVDGGQVASETYVPMIGTTGTRGIYRGAHSILGFDCNPCCHVDEFCEGFKCQPKRENGKSVGVTAWWKCLSGKEHWGNCVQCKSHDDCDDDEYCNWAQAGHDGDGLCHKKKQVCTTEKDDCTWAESGCHNNAWCESVEGKDSYCDIKAFQPNRCRKHDDIGARPNGEFCNDDSQCATGRCSSYECKALVPICTMLNGQTRNESDDDKKINDCNKGPNGECHESTDCGPDAYCKKVAGQKNACRKHEETNGRILGEFCHTDIQCASLNCKNYRCAEWGGTVELGGSCSNDEKCISGHCDNNVCVDKLPDGSDCRNKNKDSRCLSGLCGRKESGSTYCCDTGTTKIGDNCAFLPSGEDCHKNEQCATGFCDDGKCATKLPDNFNCGRPYQDNDEQKYKAPNSDDDNMCLSGYCGRKERDINYCCASKSGDNCDNLAEGENCHHDYQCSSLWCLDGVCAPNIVDGQHCGRLKGDGVKYEKPNNNDDNQCASGLCGRKERDINYCCATGSEKRGDNCKSLQDGENCHHDYQCNSLWCIDGVCATNIADGQHCGRLESDGVKYKKPNENDNNQCASRKCGRKERDVNYCCPSKSSKDGNHNCDNLAAGELCHHNYQCTDDFCDNGVCVAKLADGEHCGRLKNDNVTYESPNSDDDNQCSSGACGRKERNINYCCDTFEAGRFNTLLNINAKNKNGDNCINLAVNEKCHRNDQCTSGFCDIPNQKCSAKLADGDNCGRLKSDGVKYEKPNNDDDDQCATGLFCGRKERDVNYCCSSVDGDNCNNLAGGEACHKDSQCQTGKCNNNICAGSNLADGQTCTENYECQNKNCKNNRCAPKLGIGQECEDLNAGDSCSSGTCGRYESGSTKCCPTSAKQGDNCLAIPEGQACHHDYMCYGTAANGNDKWCYNNVCQNHNLPEGAYCGDKNKGERCASGKCGRKESGSTYCCTSLAPENNDNCNNLADGENCHENYQCRSGACTNNVCIAKLSTGVYCGSGFNHHKCQSGKCGRKERGVNYCCDSLAPENNDNCNNLADGESCHHDYQCANGVCANNVCIAKLSTGAYCGSGFNHHKCQSGKCGRKERGVNYCCDSLAPENDDNCDNLADGEGCHHDYQCQTGSSCRNNVCTEDFDISSLTTGAGNLNAEQRAALRNSIFGGLGGF